MLKIWFGTKNTCVTPWEFHTVFDALQGLPDSKSYPVREIYRRNRRGRYAPVTVASFNRFVRLAQGANNL